MAAPVIEQLSGLQLSNNDFSASPPGALSKADNLVINSKGVAEPRRGQAWASTMPAAADLPFALTEFQGFIIANYGISKTDTSMGLGYVNSGSISAYSGGPFNPSGDDGVSTSYARMKFCFASLFLHFSCSSGPKCLETYNGTPRASGLPLAQGGIGAVASLATLPTGWLPYNSSAAYRVTLKRVSSVTGVPRISAPSERIIVTNRILVPIGGLVRSGTTVTATLTTAQALLTRPGLTTGDKFTLSPGEANFAAGVYTVTGTGGLPNTITYTNAGSATSNTIAQDMEPTDSSTSAIVPVGTFVDATLAEGVVAGDVLQLWRSVYTSDSSIAPPDDVYLSNEHAVTSAEVTAGFASIQDTTPQSALSDPLYTNPSDGDGSGLDGGNAQPPIYADVCNFDSGTWYGSTTGEQSLNVEILGCGGPNGIQDGDTFTIADGVHTTTMTFKTSPGTTHETYAVTDGTPSENIAATTQNFVAKMNILTEGQGISFYSTSGSASIPGKILIQRTDFGPQFNVKVSRKESWTPALDPTTPTYSTNNAQANGLWYSKSQEPEAVPPINFRNVGSANFYVRRIFGLRNAIIILKEGDGIWSLSGSGGNYSLLQISTANIIAPDCASVFADNVWAYTDQGILRISDTGGVQVVSRPIETALNELAIDFPAETYAWSFAVAYEVERRIMFYVPMAAATSANGGAPTMQAFCYSNATNAWTGPLYPANGTTVSGIVSAEHHLWTGIYDSVFSQGRITEERKTGSYLDVAEAQWSNTLTTTANPLVVALATAGAIQQGTGISQTVNGTTWQTKIAAVNGDGTYTLAETFPWTNGSCTIYDPYPVEVQFLPQGDSPHLRKVLTRLTSLYKQGEFANYFGVTTLETDQMQAELEIPTPFVGYGLAPYGKGCYGQPTPLVMDSNPIDAKWTSAGQFRPGFKLNEVWARFKIQGLGLLLESASAPVGRSV